MVKTIQFRAPVQANEVRLVAGMADKRRRTQEGHRGQVKPVPLSQCFVMVD